jgi:hypothetical protein
MKTIIDTSRYEASHRKSPKGRGGWLFEDEGHNIVFSFSGTYAEAKKAAQESGFFGLYVCP